MSSCIAYGFFALASGARVPTHNNQTGHTTFHFHYTASIKTATNEYLPAKIRNYAGPSDNPLPDDTLAFVVAKVAAPVGHTAMIDLDAIALYALPGDPASDSYQDNVPDFPTFFFGTGHVPSQPAQIPQGAKGFTLAMAEYVGGGMRQFNLLCLFPGTNRWKNTPMHIEHITLNLAPHILPSVTNTPTPTTQRRKYLPVAAPGSSQPIASTSKVTLQSSASREESPTPGQGKRYKRAAPDSSGPTGEHIDDEEAEDTEMLGKGKRKKKARTYL
ncbi:hypothetical protein C8F01DRAFT_1129751 [Mycena amicta]|nr:hypothetical protein C8F01DRAFT_1129751 [Mycena amicta]